MNNSSSSNIFRSQLTELFPPVPAQVSPTEQRTARMPTPSVATSRAQSGVSVPETRRPDTPAAPAPAKENTVTQTRIFGLTCAGSEPKTLRSPEGHVEDSIMRVMLELANRDINEEQSKCTTIVVDPVLMVNFVYQVSNTTGKGAEGRKDQLK